MTRTLALSGVLLASAVGLGCSATKQGSIFEEGSTGGGSDGSGGSTGTGTVTSGQGGDFAVSTSVGAGAAPTAT